MTPFKTCAAIAVFATTFITSAPLSFAANTALHSKISISFSGIPIGRIKNAFLLSGDQYTVSGSIKTNSMVSIVADTKMAYSSNGTIFGRDLHPDTQHLSYKTGKKRGTSDLIFSGTNVVKVATTPKIKYKPGSVPVTKDHALNVVDPISTLVFPLALGEAPTGPNVCNRTIPIFDGKSRLALHFRYKKNAMAETKGFNGQVFTCSVRYEPIAGHRPHSKGTRFMVGRRDIEITMAPVGNSGVYALYGFKLPTRRGLVSGTAKKFKLQ